MVMMIQPLPLVLGQSMVEDTCSWVTKRGEIQKRIFSVILECLLLMGKVSCIQYIANCLILRIVTHVTI